MQIDVTGFIFALLVSAFAGVAVAALYQIFYEDRATGSQIHRSFLLMCPSITALFIAIQFSLPLSLGLLGALSIVRFRTPVKEPEEIGFLMLLIAAAVVCATFQFMLLFVLLGLAVVILVTQQFLPRLLGSKRTNGVLLLTIKGEAKPDDRDRVLQMLGAKLGTGRLQSLSCNGDQTTVHYSFNGLSAANMNGLYQSLSAIVPVEKLNIFFNRQGTLV